MNNLKTPSHLNLTATILLSQLASSYGFNLLDWESNIYLKLEQEGFDRLVLERHEPHVFSLSHYYVQNGDLMADPDVTFLLIKPLSRLIIYPLTFQQDNLGIYREVAYLNSERNHLSKFKPAPMEDLVDFCNTWASNIYAQAWFLSKSKPNPSVTVTTR